MEIIEALLILRISERFLRALLIGFVLSNSSSSMMEF